MSRKSKSALAPVKIKKKRKNIFTYLLMGGQHINRTPMGNFIMLLFLLVAGVFMALPLVYVIMNAFKPMDEIFAYPPRFFVHNPTIQNFIDLMNLLNTAWVPFTRYLFNTVFVTAAGTVGNLICGSMCAYVLSRHKFPGRDFIFELIVLSLMFTPAVLAVPNYITMANLGWIDNYLAPIVPTFAATLGLYLMKQFMDGLPEELLEAARLEGASEFVVYYKIVMPAVKPAWLTMIIFSIQSMWNASSIYIYDESLKSLAQAMGQITAGGVARAGASGAVGLVMMSVPVIAFIISQSQIMETMSTSGMKG